VGSGDPDGWLSTLARLLRAAPLPVPARARIWRALTRGRAGTPYIYPTTWRHVAGVHGGVCGVSDYTLFTDLATYEAESVRAIEEVLGDRRRPVVIDVGAHSGAWVFIVKAMHPDATVHAFEPFPALAAFITLLAGRNGWTDVHVEQAIVGAASGEGELHFAPGATDCASTVADFQSGFSQALRVPRVTLDEYVDAHRLEPIALIKIDVEGGELEVLQGAHRTLERLRPPLLMEVLFTTNPAHARRQQEAVALLQQFGYAFFHIQVDGRLVRQEVVRPDPAYKALNYLVTAPAAILSDSSPTLTA
jgi:FkbM family methyltransferase